MTQRTTKLSPGITQAYRRKRTRLFRRAGVPKLLHHGAVLTQDLKPILAVVRRPNGSRINHTEGRETSSLSPRAVRYGALGVYPQRFGKTGVKQQDSWRTLLSPRGDSRLPHAGPKQIGAPEGAPIEHRFLLKPGVPEFDNSPAHEATSCRESSIYEALFNSRSSDSRLSISGLPLQICHSRQGKTRKRHFRRA